MKPIVIFGVCHTPATLDETLKEFDKFPFNKNTLVFIEPKKRLIEGVEKCSDPNIMRFFKGAIRYLFKRGASIVPLNPSFTPSHYDILLYRKIAHQFAEEEYMVDIIASTETNKQKVVIVGDAHAPRMQDLLMAKGFKVIYKCIAEKTPSDILFENWRQAIMGHVKKLINIRWLQKFKGDLRKKFSLPKESKIPEIFYGDEKLYHQYVDEAKMMIKEGKEQADNYLAECSKKLIDDTKEIKSQTLELIKKFKKKEHHEAIHDEKLR